MYDYLSGRLAVRKPSYAVVDVNGVGYRVEIPLSTYEKLPREGAVKLLVYLRVTEDDHRLFGFLTERERELFLRLMGVQQLGPSKAIAILSSIAPEPLARAIEAGDAAALKRVKGIGEKLANRLILELRGKLPEEAGKEGEAASIIRDVAGALVSLGYDRRAAEEAAGKAAKAAPGAPVEDLIKRSLSYV